jgi:hypothetical protein
MRAVAAFAQSAQAQSAIAMQFEAEGVPPGTTVFTPSVAIYSFEPTPGTYLFTQHAADYSFEPTDDAYSFGVTQ